MRPAVLLMFLSALGFAEQSSSGQRQIVFSDLRTQAPVVTRKVEPEYSQRARDAGIEGTVVLYVEIGVDGRAHRIRVIKGLGFGLDRKAIEAVRQWEFEPGMKNGVFTNTPATIDVKFKLPPVRI